MPVFEGVIGFLGYVNMLAWVVASGAAYKFSRIFPANNKSWRLIMIGSLLVLGRQIIKLLPAYQTLDSVYIARYGVGGIGALILLAGFLNLYFEVKK